jgi:hypothetical protein
MSVKTMVLAAAAAVTLAAPAAALAHDYHGYDRGDYGASYGYRHDDGYGWRRGYERSYEHDWRARWDGPARYRDHDGWRGYGWRGYSWRYGDHGRYGD